MKKIISLVVILATTLMLTVAVNAATTVTATESGDTVVVTVKFDAATAAYKFAVEAPEGATLTSAKDDKGDAVYNASTGKVQNASATADFNTVTLTYTGVSGDAEFKVTGLKTDAGTEDEKTANVSVKTEENTVEENTAVENTPATEENKAAENKASNGKEKLPQTGAQIFVGAFAVLALAGAAVLFTVKR